MDRKLAAIFAADVVGYSRLMGADEQGTLSRLKLLRKDLVAVSIAAHGGRIVKLMGDGLLAEFASAVEAVRSAVEIQEAMATWESDRTESERLKLRIGLNLGDVIVDGQDLYGEGVNVAARLEALAESGGICLSGSVHDTVSRKLNLAFEDIGFQQLKNIEKPLQVYRLSFAHTERREVEPVSFDTPESESPSIAVLPFDNMSGDASQDFFSDGLSEDIITELSRYRSILVIARNSSFSYRGKAVDIRTVGRELGVRFVLEGSLRKAGDRLRVTAQLINAESGQHIWAERFDRRIHDIFEIQDDITRTIVTTIAGRLDDFEDDHLGIKPPEDLTAYESVLLGQKCMHDYSEAGYAAARDHFERAVARDPRFARAHALLAYLAIFGFSLQMTPEVLHEAVRIASDALRCDEAESRGHLALGSAQLFLAEHEKARYHLERAMALNPNDDLILVENGRYLMYDGAPLEGVKLVEQGMRRNPYHPNWYWNILGRCHHTAGDYEAGAAAFERVASPQFWTHAHMAGCYHALGRKDEASEHVALVMAREPDFTLTKFASSLPYREAATLRNFLEKLADAGLPD